MSSTKTAIQKIPQHLIEFRDALFLYSKRVGYNHKDISLVFNIDRSNVTRAFARLRRVVKKKI